MSPRRGPPYLGIDFGTTSTKSARIDVETGALTDVSGRAPPRPDPAKGSR